MGRPNSCPWSYTQAYYHSAKTPISIRYRPGVKHSYVWIQAGVDHRWAKKATNAMKETLQETNRLKSNCSAKSSIYDSSWDPLSSFSFAMAMWPLHRIHAPRKHRIESCEHAICEIINLQSYCGDHCVALVTNSSMILELNDLKRWLTRAKSSTCSYPARTISARIPSPSVGNDAPPPWQIYALRL